MTRTPRKCRSSSGPGGHPPLSQSHMLNVTLVFNISACSESRWPASSYARAFTHSRRKPIPPLDPLGPLAAEQLRGRLHVESTPERKNCLSLALWHAWKTRKHMADQNTLLDMSLGIFLYTFFYPVMPSSMATRVLPSTHTLSYHL